MERQSSFSQRAVDSPRFLHCAAMLAMDAVQPEGHSPMKPKRTLGARPFPQSFRKSAVYRITGKHIDECTEARHGDCRPDEKERLDSNSHQLARFPNPPAQRLQLHGELIEIS